MEKAIFFALLMFFALLGVHKAVEFVQSLFTLHLKSTVVIMYKIPNDSNGAEMAVRELAEYSKRISAPAKTAVYIVDDLLDKNCQELCRRTAEQYNNVFMGDFEGANKLLEK